MSIRNRQVAGVRERAGMGRDCLSHEQLSGIQRTRLLTAMAQVCAEHGAANVTVAHIVERAGVSRRTFYELFSDREACFLACLDDGFARIAARVVPAYEQSGEWQERVRASLIELLSFVDGDPVMGRFVIVETLGGGCEALRRRERVLGIVIDAIDEGRLEAKADSMPTRLTAEGVVGGVLSVLHGRLLAREWDSFLELLNPLMSMLVLPYFGSAAARRELSRPVPRAKPHSAPGGGSSPLKRLDMRLTYRTVRALMAVAENPGSSNRMVGMGAGILDQGQTSKLLSRLEKLSLISNDGLAPGRGAPSAWRLTEKGKEVHDALAGQITDL